MTKYLTLSLLLFVSCKYTQICEISPSQKDVAFDKFYFYENGSVKIKYSFWDESGGSIAFTFTNKLNTPLYIDWKKCSFVKNGIKYNYWEDIKTTKSTWLTFGAFDYNNYAEINTKREISSKPERITFMAPKSTIIRVWTGLQTSQINLNSKKNCELPINGSDKSKKVKCQEYNTANSFLVFRNFMTISTSEKFDKEEYIDNEFYVSKVYQMDINSFDPFWFRRPASFFIK